VGIIKSQKAIANTLNLTWKNPKGKNHGEREENSTITMVIQVGFSGVLGFLD